MPGAWEHHCLHIKYNQYIDTCVMLYIKSCHCAVILGVTMNCIISLIHRDFAHHLVANSVNNFVPEVHRSVNISVVLV